MKRDRMIVNGFAFADKRMAQKAWKEAESIQYVKEKLDMENPRMVLEMYHKLIKENVFKTPVGILYLKQLQDYLSGIPEIRMEGLEPIQAGDSQETKGSAGNPGIRDRIRPTQAGDSQETKGSARNPSIRDGVRPIQAGNSQEQEETARYTDAEELADWYEEQLEQEKQKRRAAEMRQRQTESSFRSRKGFLRFSVAANVFLLIMVIGIVVITLTDSNPNIINYENKIVDKYTEWEQGLEEREQNIRKREQELGL